MQKLQRTGATVAIRMNYSKLFTHYTMKADELQATDNYLQGIIELVRLAKKNTMKTLQYDGWQRFRLENQGWFGKRSDAVEQRHPQPVTVCAFSPAIERQVSFTKSKSQ